MEHRSLNPANADQTALEPFRPDLVPLAAMAELHRPVTLCYAEAARFEDLKEFLRARIPGSKVVVGAGIDGEALAMAFPEVRFLGRLEGTALAQAYCAADVFVPAARDGRAQQRMIEALACGVPLAATANPAALALIGPHGRGTDSELPMTVGAIDADLSVAVQKALRLDRLGAAVFGARMAARYLECDAAPSITEPDLLLALDAA